MRGKKSFFSLSLIPSFSSLPFDSLYPFLSRFSFSCLPLTFYLFLNIHISFTQSLFIFSLFSFVLISSFTLFPIHIHMIIRIFFFFFFLIRYISFSFLFFSVYIYIYLFNFFFLIPLLILILFQRLSIFVTIPSYTSSFAPILFHNRNP